MYSLKAYIPYYKRNLEVAVPVMLTQFGGALVGLADSIMVGHYSTTDLAAVSFANGVFFTFLVFAMGALMGVTPLAGQSYVQKDDKRVSSLLQNGLLFTTLLIIATCFVLLLCLPFINKMGQDENVVVAARPYLLMRIIGLAPFLYFCFFKQFLEGLGNTMVAMLITVGANVLNILLNWVFIFGKLGCSQMGAAGAGLASLIASFVYTIGIVFVIFKREEWAKYFKLFCRDNNDKSVVKELSKVGFPIGVQTTMETVLFTISFIMVGWISKETLAAHHIANQIADLAFMLSLGVGAATTIRVSHQYGLRDYESMRMAGKASVHLVLLMNTIGASVMIGLRNYIPYIFTTDESVIPIASTLLVYAGIFQYSDGLQCIGAGLLRGITDVKMPMVLAFVAYVVIALPLGYLLMFTADMGVSGMWLSFILALSMAAIGFHVRFWRKADKM